MYRVQVYSCSEQIYRQHSNGHEEHIRNNDYDRSWKAWDCTLEIIRNDSKQSHYYLPSYLHICKVENPSSITKIETDEYNVLE